MNDSKGKPKKQKQIKTTPKDSVLGSGFAKVVKIMAETAPVSNEELVKQKKDKR